MPTGHLPQRADPHLLLNALAHTGRRMTLPVLEYFREEGAGLNELPLSSRDGLFSPFQNATEYVGPDACGAQSWNLLDVELPLSRTQEPGVTLAPLKPWTQYAVFVRAITLTTAEDSPHQGAQSPIVYLRTLPAGRLKPLKGVGARCLDPRENGRTRAPEIEKLGH